MATPLSIEQAATTYVAAPSAARESVSRRALNISVALVLLVLCLPLMLATALLIRLTSPGPVLFTQVRIGLDRRSRTGRASSSRRTNYGGQPFTIYKFRTMYVHHCNGNKQVWAVPDDVRVTPIGRFLRRFRLDELPQLFNVLRGDMNVVGPRPEQPEICQHLRRYIPGYDYRQRVRPGITGLAQVCLPYDRTLEDVRRKVAMDLQYLERQSVLTDLEIMVRTPLVMLARKNGW